VRRGVKGDEGEGIGLMGFIDIRNRMIKPL
jgi:hypothetical protein